MSLSFLVPLFLLGLAGVAIPVLIHLTRRQRRRVVAFPSLMFLRQIPFQEQRRRRIQNWLLLSLRALALILLAVAFARPLLEDADLVTGVGSGPTEVVVLLDQSFSMSVGDEWERARDAARSVFRELGPLDRASLVLFSQGASVVARSTTDAMRLQGALDTVAVGSGITRYGPALKVAQSILEESELPGREVVLVSDFQRGGWRGDEGVHLPPGTVVRAVAVQDPEPENVLVADLSLLRQADAGRERVTATVRVARRGGSAAVQVPVSLELEGQLAQTRSVALQPDGSAAVTFAPFTLSLPHTRGTVRLPADELDADDARHFVLSPGSAVHVLVAEGGRTGTDASLYLRRALETSDEGRFDVRIRRGDGLRPADLEGMDVLILNDARLDGGSAEQVRAFAEAGGGVLVILGEAASWPSSAQDVLPAVPGAAEDRSEGRGGRLGFLDYEHPVFEIFAGPRSGDFSGARFFRARAMTQGDSSQALARFDDGSLAMAERHVGRGRVVVWSSTLDQFWNDLALQPVYLPFVHRLVDHLSGRTESVWAFAAGQVVDLADRDALERAGMAEPEAAGMAVAEDQVAITPSGAVVSIAEDTPGHRYLPLEERGFYAVRRRGTDPDRPLTLAVNVEIAESSLERMDPQELVAQITPAPESSGGGTSLDALALRREDRERRQSFWRYLLAGAFALLLLETGLSNWISRRGGIPRPAAG